ncbi:hypothetical protein [Tenggerimyces flavus]|uniref:Uncharacterized protein n=1 Tax=Tenggerimyces flavus TaxID=1708749 RepID=A0ABV7Y9Q2_9ACTN|nr:hypothetical protein [Tenggerimyces flavus]MBM7788892.1 hypothetical protein [Tenggerimyces flavus]
MDSEWGNVVLTLEMNGFGLPAPVVQTAPPSTLVAGELIRRARAGELQYLVCENREDGRTVLRVGTEGRGMGVVAYELVGIYHGFEPPADTWRARRIE